MNVSEIANESEKKTMICINLMHVLYYPSFPGVIICSSAFFIASDILNVKKKQIH